MTVLPFAREIPQLVNFSKTVVFKLWEAEQRPQKWKEEELGVQWRCTRVHEKNLKNKQMDFPSSYSHLDWIGIHDTHIYFELFCILTCLEFL